MSINCQNVNSSYSIHLKSHLVHLEGFNIDCGSRNPTSIVGHRLSSSVMLCQIPPYLYLKLFFFNSSLQEVCVVERHF